MNYVGNNEHASPEETKCASVVTEVVGLRMSPEGRSNRKLDLSSGYKPKFWEEGF